MGQEHAHMSDAILVEQARELIARAWLGSTECEVGEKLHVEDNSGRMSATPTLGGLRGKCDLIVG